MFKSPRWYQFNLRTLLGLTTLFCVGLAIYVGRQRYLEHSVNSFNTLIDEDRFAEAEALARHVHRWYGTVLTEAMVEKAAFAGAWMRNERVEEDGHAFGGPDHGDVDSPIDSGWHFGNSVNWEDLISAQSHQANQHVPDFSAPR